MIQVCYDLIAGAMIVHQAEWSKRWRFFGLSDELKKNGI